MTAAELAALIGERLAAIEATKPDDRANKWGWRTYFEKVRALVDELKSSHGAEYRRGGAHHFRLAGISASSEVGEVQMLRNWVKAARAGSA